MSDELGTNLEQLGTNLELKEAIEEIRRESVSYDMVGTERDSLSLVLSAAEKQDVMDWMHDEGFADDYSFGYVMEHMQDFIDAYRKAREGA
jgi:hypothetical protein